jgi:hypothetical protein
MKEKREMDTVTLYYVQNNKPSFNHIAAKMAKKSPEN